MEQEKYNETYLLESLENSRNLALKLAVGVNFYLEQCKENTPQGVIDEALLIIRELKRFNLSSIPKAKHQSNVNSTTGYNNNKLSISAPNTKSIYPKVDNINQEVPSANKITPFTTVENNCFTIISYHLLPSTRTGFDEIKLLVQVVEKLQNYQSDIFCLQDVKKTSFDFIIDFLSKFGYGSMPIILPTNSTGLAIFWKTNRFTLKDHGMYPHITASQIYYCNFLFGSDTITVLNVHLIDHKYHFIMELQKWLSTLGNNNNNRIILCGDFCVEPRSFVFDHICYRDHQSMFTSVYKEKWRKEPSYTCQRISFFETLDYIIYNKNKFHLDQVLPVPYGKENLPNSSSPSDHLPVGAKFIIW